MQVLETLQTVKIQTNNSEIFQQTRALLHKNFSGCIGKKSKLISFCRDDELVQRRYFFKWLNCLNRKINHTDLHLERSFYKTLHLKFLQKQTLKVVISAKITFSGAQIVINFSQLDAALIAYLRNFFKDHDCAAAGTKLSIAYKNEQSLQLLEQLARSNQHLNKIISFELDELEFLRFKQNLPASSKQARRFLNLCALYEEQFRILQITPPGSMSELKERYRQLARKYHPDHHTHESEQVRALCAERFAAINEAYECLRPLYLRTQKD